jgi:hypothetical protein
MADTRQGTLHDPEQREHDSMPRDEYSLPRDNTPSGFAHTPLPATREDVVPDKDLEGHGSPNP